MLKPLVTEKLSNHIANVWPTEAKREFVWKLGPIAAKLPDFRVVRIEPKTKAEPWVYITIGAWEANRDKPREFLLLSPTEEALHVELLAMVTDYHSYEQHRLDVGDVIAIGRPWLDQSSAERLLVSQPYPYGPKLEWCDVGDRRVQFLWLMPILASEADFVKRNGLQALEVKFDEVGIDYLDPHRPPVV